MMEIENTIHGRGLFLRQAVIASWIILIICVIYQVVFFPEIINLIAIVSAITAWALTCMIWLKTNILRKYLISAFMILGFVSSQFYFPVVFTTLEDKPVTYNLDMPEDVFLHSSLCFLVLVVAHAVYRYSRRLSFQRSTSLMSGLGFFDPPSHLQVWIMGLIGMASSFYVYFTSPDIGREITGAAEDKLLQGLVPFTYAPFLIVVARLYGNQEKVHKGFTPLIILYAVALFAVSIARNSRGAFILGLTTPVFAYVLGLMLGVYKNKLITFKNVVLAAAAAWVLVGPLSDLGTAMLIVRGSRTDVSPTELVVATLDALDDKAAIEARRKDDADASMDWDWDERYLDNLFTARFSNIKFNDSNLITSTKVGQYDPDMQQYSLDAFIAIFPQPLIDLFDLDVDKDWILSMSFGDFMYALSGGQGTLEGYRTGHVAGTGLAAFGWWYLALLGISAIPLFYLNDKLVKNRLNVAAGDNGSINRTYVSMCAVLFLTTFFQFMMLESVVQIMTYLVRGWLQMVALYFIIYHVSLRIARLFEKKKRFAVQVDPRI